MPTRILNRQNTPGLTMSKNIGTPSKMVQKVQQMSKLFEDLEIGQTFHSPGDHLMTREAIIAFAKEWDPQAYHIDDEAAVRSPVGKIFASTFHSMAVAQNSQTRPARLKSCQSSGSASPKLSFQNQ